MNRRAKLAVLFLVSLLGHLLFFRLYGAEKGLEPFPDKLKYVEVTPVDLKDLGKLDAHQVIELPPGPDQQPDQAKYLSERAMKTEQETMGPPGAAFAGHSAPPVPPSQAFLQGGSAGNKNPSEITVLDRLKPSLGEVMVPQSNSSNPGQVSGSIDFLDGAVTGEITLANAYKFKHADFFNQLKRSIAFYWNPRPALQLVPPSSNDLITRVRFIINQNGTLAGDEIIDSSGFPSVDRAGVSAIRNATPVFNVPAELLDNNQQVVIICAFRIMR